MNTNEQYEKIANYIDNNPVAVLGTIDEDGGPYGAVVYVCADPHQQRAYLLTKNETRKYKNLSRRDKVSLTIANKEDNSTLQATGRAAVIHDSTILDMVLKKMVRANPFASEWVPPVSKLQAGQYTVVQIELEHARLAEFNAGEPGSDQIFTEIV